jgi:eukaryotic-like serine/threonine-protein kinase
VQLQAGSRLGAYEILGLVGAGGMGEVYRARDTKLGRDVALKILPEVFAADPDRLARFQREAQVLASLSHHNIAAIHGLEESNGIRALALEFVEGPTLADRIAQGPIPLEDALSLARQIAEAFEAAHEHGIVHRDLKPANIKVRPDGTVKILDFGLAKLAESTGAGRPGSTPAESPTITTPAMTQMGVILGTAAYMSPEQAKGRPVDKRTDVWAFGCTLYEMLTGRRAFEGDDVSDTMASVLKSDPTWSALPVSTPPSIERLLRRCMAKDRNTRIPYIAIVRYEIEEALTGSHANPSERPKTPVAARSVFRRALPVVAAALVASIVVGLVVWFALRPGAKPIVRLTVASLSPDVAARLPNSWSLVITPDGRRVVYTVPSENSDAQVLYVRALDELDPKPLTRTNTGSPFISPDGKSVGFFDLGTLKRVAIDGGPTVTICTGQTVPLVRAGDMTVRSSSPPPTRRLGSCECPRLEAHQKS